MTQIAELASLAGSVYFDTNRNGVRDTGEDGIAGVAIALSGTDDLGSPVNQSQTTDANGDYLFTDLVPGTYSLTLTQPEGLGDGQTSVCTSATGTTGTNEITTIDQNSGANTAECNLGETLSAQRVLTCWPLAGLCGSIVSSVVCSRRIGSVSCAPKST